MATLTEYRFSKRPGVVDGLSNGKRGAFHYTTAGDWIGEFRPPSAKAVEWRLPAGIYGATRGGLERVRVGPRGGLWTALAGGDFLVRLDPHTNAWTLIEGGPNYRGVARGLTFDGRGRAWYRLEGAPPGPGHLVRYDPAAGTSELWSLPVLFGAPGALCVDARGHVWATFTTARGRGHGIGHLDPVARTFDEFRVASGQESYHGLATDPAGTSVWFTYEIFQSGVRPQNLTVFRLDLATRRCHGFPLRSLSTIGRQPRRLEVDARGDGWFVDESHFVGKISKTQVCARHPLDWKTTKVGHTKTRPNVTEEQGAPPVVRSATIYNPPVLLWDTACSTDFFVPGVVPHGLALYGGSAWFADGPLNNRRAIFRLTP